MADVHTTLDDTEAARAGFGREEQPIFAFSGNGRLLWANAAAAAFWDVRRRDALLGVDWERSGLGGRLRTLGAALPVGSTTLQRLPLMPFGRTTPLLAQLRRLPTAMGDVLVVIGQDRIAPGRLAAVDQAWPSAASGAAQEEPQGEAAASPAADAHGAADSIAAQEAEADAMQVDAVRPSDPAAEDALAAGASEEPAPSIEPPPVPAERDLPVAEQLPPVDAAQAAESVAAQDAAAAEPAIDAIGRSDPAASPDAEHAGAGADQDVPFADEGGPPATPAADAEPAASEAGQGAAPVPPVEHARSEPAADGAPLSDRAAAIAARSRPLRFVWQTDAAGRLSFVSPDLKRLLGDDALPGADETLAEFAARQDIPSGALGEAMAEHRSWSELVVEWPVAGGPERAMIELSGMPAGRGGAYRGFGFLRGLVRDGSAAPTDSEPAAPSAAETRAPQALVAEAPPPPPVAPRLEPADEEALRAIRSVLGGPIAAPRPRFPESEAAAPSAATVEWNPSVAVPADEPTGETDAPSANEGGSGPVAAAEDAALPADQAPATAPLAGPASGSGDGRSTPPAEAAPPTRDPAAEAVAAEPAPPAPDDAALSASEPPPPAGPEPEEAAASSPVAALHARAAEPPADDPPASAEDGPAFAVPAGVSRTEDGDGPGSRPDLSEAAEPAAAADAMPARHTLRATLLPIPATDAEEAAPTRILLPQPFRAERRARAPAPIPPPGAPLTVAGAAPFLAPQAALPPTAPPDETAGLRRELAAAAERERELRGIIDTASDGVVLLTAGGRILSLNRAAEALFGVEGSEMEGGPLARLVAPESQRAALDYLEGLAGNGVASVLNDGREIVGLERHGGRIPLFMTVGRLSSDADGERFCAVLRDITQWKAAERELTEARRQAERASQHKSDFLAKVSHEIRTPLNTVIGFAEAILEERFGAVGSERYRSYVGDIRGAGAHLLALVNDLLDLSKIESGRVDLTFAQVQLADVVQQVAAAMQPQANRDGVILRTALPAVPPVVADARAVRQILFNLVSSAIRFTRSGGQVIVSTVAGEDGGVALRVRDTGIGMNDTEITLALEPFRQLATRSRVEDGSGLGLSLTKALTEANRATFAIQSVPGEGTVVQVTFPPTRVLAE